MGSSPSGTEVFYLGVDYVLAGGKSGTRYLHYQYYLYTLACLPLVSGGVLREEGQACYSLLQSATAVPGGVLREEGQTFYFYCFIQLPPDFLFAYRPAIARHISTHRRRLVMPLTWLLYN